MNTVSVPTERGAQSALIVRLKQLDPRAFDEVVDDYSPRLYGFLYRLIGRIEEAHELVQEVFLRLVRGIGAYQDEGRFEAWLFRIAGNVARDYARRKARQPRFESLDGPVDHDAPEMRGSSAGRIGGDNGRETEWMLSRGEDEERLQRALLRLPEAEREVILLRHYSEMSFAEIAELMETPLGTALARAHRGLKKLREWMEQVP